MALKIYDLAGADPNRRFSPFCWRIKLALAHKQLEVETVPWRYQDKPLLAFAKWDRVPVIVDGTEPVVDSWNIANYLEDKYGSEPSLFGGPDGRNLTRFYNAWADTVLNGAISRFVAVDIFNHLTPGDQPYFRKTREDRFGMSLEEYCKDREARLPAFRQTLEPVRQTLAAQSFLGGDAPLYADYIVFGSLMWARCVSSLRLLDHSDPVNAWSERMLDAHGGLARNAPRYW